MAQDLPGRLNIHILRVDSGSHDDLKVWDGRTPRPPPPRAAPRMKSPVSQKAAVDMAAITGGKLDCLIAKAGYVANIDSFTRSAFYISYCLSCRPNSGNGAQADDM